MNFKKSILVITGVLGAVILVSKQKINATKRASKLAEQLVEVGLCNRANAKVYVKKMSPADMESMLQMLDSGHLRHFAGPIEWTN